MSDQGFTFVCRVCGAPMTGEQMPDGIYMYCTRDRSHGTTSDPDRLAEIKARMAAATPGPWFRSPERGVRLDGMSTVRARDGNRPVARIRSVDREKLWPDPDAQTQLDAEFIANAPADIDWLVGEVEKARLLVLELAAVAARQHGLLDRLEWAAGYEGQRYCPACGSGEHAPDCWLAAAIAERPAPTPKG